MPTVASSAVPVQPHCYAPDPRGRAHDREPPHPFAELLDSASGEPPSPPPHATSPKDDHPAGAADAQQAKQPTTECTGDANQAMKSEDSECKDAGESIACALVEADCAEDLQPIELAEILPVPDDLKTSHDSEITDKSVASDAPVGTLVAFIEPAPQAPAAPTPQVFAPPAVMPAELGEAIATAEPVDAMPPAPPVLATLPEADPVAPVAEPHEGHVAAASLQGQGQVATASRQSEQLAMPRESSNVERQSGEQDEQDAPSEQPPAPKGPPPHAIAAGHSKHDKERAAHSGARFDSAQQAGVPAEVQPSNGADHATAQTQALLVADAHAVSAPASEKGIAHGIPAPAVAVPIAGLAIEIASRMQAGRNRFEIRLDPPELGRVDVRLDVDREGYVTSRLVVERVETFELLRRDAAQLERALQQAGLKTADNALQFTLRDHSSAQRDDELPNPARVVAPDPELAPVDSGRIYGRWLGVGGGVDIRV